MRIPAIAAFAVALALPASPSTFDAKTASFAVSFHGQISAYRDAALTLLPGAAVTIGAVGGPAGDYAADIHDGMLVQQAVRQWKWTPPARATRKENPVLTQFACKEDTSTGFPKYVVLHEKLPLKLEAVLERVNAIGVRVDTLHVMSAYRTPFYNRAIGDAKYSMHQWGGAADICVDPLNDDRMADLNHDGQVDVEDATAAHPPFVHVDVRGAAARWKG